MNSLLIKILLILSYLLILINFISACSTNVGNISLTDEVYLDQIQGTYQLSTNFIQQINKSNNYFLDSPNPQFTQLNLFIIPSSGTIDINNSNSSSQFILSFQSTIDSDNNSAIFKVYLPTLNNSGNFISNKSYIKITLDTNTNLLYSDSFSSNYKEAELKIATNLLSVFLGN